jgi:hypothetical protein
VIGDLSEEVTASNPTSRIQRQHCAGGSRSQPRNVRDQRSAAADEKSKAGNITSAGWAVLDNYKRQIDAAIGKDHVTYGQGAAAEITAIATIGAADCFRLPVSTTHVLSSGVAGAMAANRSGLQWSMTRNLALAWVLTLPASIVIARPSLRGLPQHRLIDPLALKGQGTTHVELRSVLVDRTFQVGCILAALSLLTGRPQSIVQTTVNRAGATFPAPVYSMWFSAFQKVRPEIQIAYQGIESGGGVRQILEGVVDFGATDGAMTEKASRVQGRSWIQHHALRHRTPRCRDSIQPSWGKMSGRKRMHQGGGLLRSCYRSS